MNVNDIFYLKSDNTKLMVTWVFGVTKNTSIPIDIDKMMKMSPTFQSDDIAVKYNKDKKATIPFNALIDNLANRIPAKTQNLDVGNVVKHKLTDKEMTITWVVGQKQVSSPPVNFNKLCEIQGFSNGDIVCGFFDKKVYKTELVKKGEVIKLYE
tara:strand:- start:2293 stop:2754 length:462 start_codon:yes stop_codon:yes gene_type:complete